jgi:hypothetical protein
LSTLACCQIIEDFTFVGMAQPTSMQPFGRGADEVIDLIDIFIMNFRYDAQKHFSQLLWMCIFVPLEGGVQ